MSNISLSRANCQATDQVGAIHKCLDTSRGVKSVVCNEVTLSLSLRLPEIDYHLTKVESDF